MIEYIALNNVVLNGFVGCLPEERITKSKISLTVKLKVNLPELLGQNKDKIQNTIDYRKIITTLEKTLNQRHYAIIENLGEHMADDILQSFENVIEVRISLSKPEVFENQIIPEVGIVRKKK